MLTIVLIMISGILAGYLLRKRQLSTLIIKTVTVLIWLLLLILGIEVGSNGKLMSSLHSIGLTALTLSVAGTLGSMVLAKLLWMWIRSKQGDKEGDDER